MFFHISLSLDLSDGFILISTAPYTPYDDGPKACDHSVEFGCDDGRCPCKASGIAKAKFVLGKSVTAASWRHLQDWRNVETENNFEDLFSAKLRN